MITTKALIAEVGDMSQFKNERRLFSFLGLTPREYSSGEHVRKGHITKQGNPSLRGLLVEAAWTAVEKDKDLKKTFEKLQLRMGKKKAIVAIARRLAGRIRACIRENIIYQTSIEVSS